MSLSDFMRHQQAAVAFWHQGRHRESANEYWEAFQILPPTHEARYQIFHGYTTTVRMTDSFEASEDDIKNMKKIFDNKHEPRLFRLEAAFTLGVIYYAQNKRHLCEDIYHSAIVIGEKDPKKRQEKDEEKKMIIMTPGGIRQEKTMKELMEGVVKDCQKNLDGLRGVQEVRFGPEEQPTKRTHLMPIGMRGTSLTQDEINNLIDVGGGHCDFCKTKEKKLFKCSRCNRGFYCSKDCQKKQWKEKDHKSHCRKEEEFKPNDLVQIARLKNKPEMNNNIVRVIGPDTTTTGRYKVRMEGGVSEDPIFSISVKNLNQMRPYDCRN